MAIRIPCTAFTCHGIRTSTSQGAPWLTETWGREDVWCWETSLNHLAWEFLVSGFGLGIFGFGFWVGVWCLVFGFTSRKYPKPPIFLWVFAWKKGCYFFFNMTFLERVISKHDCGRKGILTQLSHIILPKRRGKKNSPPWSKRLHRKRREKWQIPTTTKK